MQPQDFISKHMNGKSFFHFTDIRNVPLIREHGLLSLQRLRERRIVPPAVGGNDWSHQADERMGLHCYVHLCFLEEHPMEYRARQDGRIERTVFIRVSSSVLLNNGVLFSSDVSNKAGTQIRDIAEALPMIDAEVIYTRTDWKDPAIQSRRQAARKCELLVPNHIPVELLSGY